MGIRKRQDSICFASGYLTQEEIKEFQILVNEAMNKKLTYEEAEDQGSRLTMVFEALQKFEPIPLSGKDIVEIAHK